MTAIDRYEQQATILPLRNAGAHEDLVAQAVDEKRTWREIQRDIDLAGDPTNLTGGIAGLELTPPTVNETLVTGGATELAIFPTARTPIVQYPRGPVLYRLFAAGTSTTAATPGTYTLAARVGTANTSPLFRCGVECPDAGRFGHGGALAVLRDLLPARQRFDGHGVRVVRVQPFGHGRRRWPGQRDG
jgi:hypothetical protein